MCRPRSLKVGFVVIGWTTVLHFLGSIELNLVRRNLRYVVSNSQLKFKSIDS